MTGVQTCPLPISDVKFCEEGGILHVVDEFGDEQQRVRIPDSVGIKISVVLARA